MALAPQLASTPPAVTDAAPAQGMGSPSGIPSAPPAASGEQGTSSASESTSELTARLEKLEKESLPKLQSDHDAWKGRAETAEAKLAEIGDPDEMEFEIASDVEAQWSEWMHRELALGTSLAALVAAYDRQRQDTDSKRQRSDSAAATVDAVIGFVEGYDKGFATFLRALAKAGGAISQEKLPELLSTFKDLAASGQTPGQAAATAAAGTTDAAPAAAGAQQQEETPPVTPQPGGASRVSAAPIARPGGSKGMLDYFAEALPGMNRTRIAKRT